MTVLSQGTIVVENMWLLVIIVVGLAFSTFLTTFGVCYAVKEKKLTFHSIVGVIGLVITFMAFSYASGDYFTYNKYQVTLDDTYPAKAFLEKYEVIDVEGDIYTIREKYNKYHKEEKIDG